MEGAPPDAGAAVIASDHDTKISNPSRGIVAWATRLVSRTNAETLANAKLIAAAPELFEALANMVEAAEAEANEKGAGGYLLARLTDARAAIAKARS